MSCDGDERFFNRSGDEITNGLHQSTCIDSKRGPREGPDLLGEELETKDSFSETTETMEEGFPPGLSFSATWDGCWHHESGLDDSGSQGAEIIRSPEGTAGAEVSSELIIKIVAKDRSNLNQQLDRAVTTVQAQAIGEGRRGILITRHSHDTFSVALSEAVPFGQTLEYRAW